ncbi:MAG TPA: GNAT family N-acetyltransferase, partial [Blastocatellia bacterium]|nr:GNAT family N-acetyltransferase [Blastocatellia bacterium]
MRVVDDSFLRWSVAPEQMDWLWAQGWRHFGTYFFRYSVAVHWGGIQTVLPLRIDLSKFSLSRSQKRIWARNRDLRIVVRETSVDQVKEDLFDRHRDRFKDNVPDSLYDFLSNDPARVPCRNHEICVYQGERLMAVSFLDLGATSTSAVYAMFEPEESKRSLGILTMLEAIRYSKARGCRYYYPGYAYRGSSVYDYKKNFIGLEYFDWESAWHPYPRRPNPPAPGG